MIYLDWYNMTGTVDHREVSSQQQLSHHRHILLVSASQSSSLVWFEDAYSSEGSRQIHGRKGSGEYKASSIASYSVNQSMSACDVASDIAERFT